MKEISFDFIICPSDRRSISEGFDVPVRARRLNKESIAALKHWQNARSLKTDV